MSDTIDPTTAENDVREKAAALADAIEVARRVGYSVSYPSTVDGLRSIAISGTARVPEPPKEEPAAVEAAPANRPAPAAAARTAPAGTTTTADTVKDAIGGAVKGN